jgi:hypothetical protein
MCVRVSRIGRGRALSAGLLVAIVVLVTPSPAGAVTADSSNVHGCAISMKALGNVGGIDWRRYTELYLQGANSPACGALRVSLTVFTDENGTTRSARTNFDEANYGPPFPTDNFLLFVWQHGSFKYARAHFSWCADGTDSCTSRTRTRATMYKGGNILFG